MGTGAKVILLPVVSLLGVPAEMLMFPSDIRLLAGSPGAPDPVLPLGPFATTGAKPILGKAGAPVHAELLDEAQEATLWLPPRPCHGAWQGCSPREGTEPMLSLPQVRHPGQMGHHFHQEPKAQNLLSLSVGVGRVLAFSPSPLPELLSISKPGTSPSSLGNASPL